IQQDCGGQRHTQAALPGERDKDPQGYPQHGRVPVIGKGRVHNMNAYIEMNRRHQAEDGAFPMAYAFGDEQLKEAMKKLGLKPSDTDKVCTIYGAGDIIRKSDLPAYREMQMRHREELFKAINSDETGDGFIFDMFDCEL